MTATTIGITTLIVLTATAIGTMLGSLCKNGNWALTVAITVSATITIVGITTLTLWWQ